MKISLTEKQIRQFTPFFDRVRTTAALGKPGMLVAQIRWSDREGTFWMEPGFLSHEHASLIQEKGQTCPPAPVPTESVGNTAPQSAQSTPDIRASIEETVP